MEVIDFTSETNSSFFQRGGKRKTGEKKNRTKIMGVRCGGKEKRRKVNKIVIFFFAMHKESF